MVTRERHCNTNNPGPLEMSTQNIVLTLAQVVNSFFGDRLGKKKKSWLDLCRKTCNKLPNPSELHLLGAGVLYAQDCQRGWNRQSPNPDLGGERAGAGKKREPQAATGGGAGLESSLCHLRAV